MYTVTITEKGQIVIPAKIRKQLKLKKGTKLNVEANGVQIIIKPETADYIRSLKGSLGKGGNVADMLIQEHRAEVEKEDKKWKR